MFSNLGQGSPIYVVRTDNWECLTGQVENVTPPRPKYPTFTPNAYVGLNFETVVDLSVLVGGSRREFKGVPSNMGIAPFEKDGFVLADSKDAMISYVDSTLQASRQAIDPETLDMHHGKIAGCERVMRQLNPAFAKEIGRDEAINELSSRVNAMQEEFGGVKEDIGRILGLLSKDGNS